MSQNPLMNTRKWMSVFLALLAPTVLWSAYLFISRLTLHHDAASDYAMLVISLVMGLTGIFLWSRSLRLRLMTASLYLPLMAAGLYFGMQITACNLGNCNNAPPAERPQISPGRSF